MYIDSQLIFSWGQNIYASGADVVSTNIYDNAPHLAANAAWVPDVAVGQELTIVAAITTAVTGGTSVQPVLQTDTNTNFATALVEFPLCAAIPVAQAVAGKTVVYRTNALGLKRYMRIAWRNVGANTTGVGSAYIAETAQNAPIQSASGYTVG
jgi:hypothetical protein